MDNRDFKFKIITITKVYFYLVLRFGLPGFILFDIIYIIFNFKSFDNLFINIIVSIGYILLLLVLLTLVIYGIIGIIYLFIKIKNYKSRLDTDIYVRELPKYFPPAIVSFLFDLNVESKDYTATIAYLISKKYIELDNNKIKILNENINGLSEHEKYVYNCLIKNNRFNYDEFILLVLSDAEKMNLIKKGRRKIHFFRNFGLAILSFFGCGLLIEFIKEGIFYYIISIIGFFAGLSLFGVVGYSIYLSCRYQKENFYRTSIGNVEARRWSGVKNFLNSFTLMDQKNLNDIKLYDDYIPYAIALNEAKNIEKYIENNDSYRELIFGNIYNLDN